MNHHSSSPLFSRILLGSAMLVVVLASSSALMHYGFCGNTPKIPAKKPKVGVVKGVVYSPGSSCAVVDGAMVREGDAINDVAVVGIKSNAVEFSKAGVTWQQEVLETPHEAWTSSAKADCPGGK